MGLTIGAYFLDRTENRVVFYDKDTSLISNLEAGRIHVFEPGLPEILENAKLENRVIYTNSLKDSDISIVFICISTPKESINNPVLEFLSEQVCSRLSKTAKIFIRSTVPVGTANKVSLLLKTKNLNFVEVYSTPERTAEGVAIREIASLPQLLGIDPSADESQRKNCVELLSNLQFKEVKIGIWEEVELAKLLCNVWRDYSFAFANAVNLISLNENIDVYNVTRLANSGYPRSTIPMPGPVGGPCLTKDTYILCRQLDGDLGLLLSSRKFNENYEKAIVSKIIETLRLSTQQRIIVAGLAFKGEPLTNDSRNSFGMSLMASISKNVITKELRYWDPLVSEEKYQRINSFHELRDLLNDSILVIANNNLEIANFVNSLTLEECKAIANCQIIDIGGHIKKTNENLLITNLGDLGE